MERHFQQCLLACLLMLAAVDAVTIPSAFQLSTLPLQNPTSSSDTDIPSYKTWSKGFGLESGGVVTVDLLAKVKAGSSSEGKLSSALMPYLNSPYHLSVKLMALATQNEFLATHASGPSPCFTPSVGEVVVDFNTSWLDAAEKRTTQAKWKLTAPSVGQYAVGVFLCQKGPSNSVLSSLLSSVAFILDISLVVEYVNPGGNQSTLEDIPLLNVFLSLSVIYLAYAVASFIWLVYRHCIVKKPPLKMQWLIWLAIVAKFVEAALTTGVRVFVTDDAESSDTMIYMQKIASVVAEVVLLATMVMLCRGYSFAVDELSSRDRQLIIACCLFYLVFRSAYEFDATSNDSLKAAYFYSFAMSRFVITGVSLISLSLTIEKVRKQLLTEDTNGLMETYLRYYGFWKPFAVYVVVPLIVLLLTNTILSWRNKYIEALLTETATAFYLLIVLYYFRAQAVI